MRKALVVIAASLPGVAIADEYMYQPHINILVKPGNSRTITSPEIFLPLQQNSNALLFADIRAMFDGHGNKEGNIGLGYRRLLPNDEMIYGVYGFFDRRQSQNEAYHSQITLGTELLTNTWDARANLYVPITKEKVIDLLDVSTSLAGTGLLVSAGNYREKGLFGGDLEVGYQVLPGLRLYSAGFMFGGSGTETMYGTRLRTQLEMNDYVKLGAEWQVDNVRGDQKFAELRLSFPFGEKPKKKLNGIAKRMTENVVRDIDIVTQSVAPSGEQIVTTNLLNATTGLPQEIYFVDNTAAPGGDGSVNNPFNNIATAFADPDVAANDIVYVKAGDGTTTNLTSAVTLSYDGMQLLGSGVPISFGSPFNVNGFNLPNGIPLLPAGQAPNIGGLVTVNADNTTVAGLNIRNRINVTYTSSNVLLENLYVNNGRTSNGLIIGASGQPISDITIRNVSMENIGNYGILAYNPSNISISDVSVSNGNFNGVSIHYNRTGTYSGLNIDGITTSTLPSDGVAMYLTGSNVVLNNPTISNVTTNDNGNGFWLIVNGGSTVNNLVVNRLVARDNRYWGAGMAAWGVGNTINATFNDFDIAGTTGAAAAQFTGSGLVLRNITNLTINDSVIADNANSGVVVYNDNDYFTPATGNLLQLNNVDITGNPVGINHQFNSGFDNTIVLSGGTLNNTINRQDIDLGP